MRKVCRERRPHFGDEFIHAGTALTIGAALAISAVTWAPWSSDQRLAASVVLSTVAVSVAIFAALVLYDRYRHDGAHADLDAALVVVVVGFGYVLPSQLLVVVAPSLVPTAASVGLGVAVLVPALAIASHRSGTLGRTPRATLLVGVPGVVTVASLVAHVAIDGVDVTTVYRPVVGLAFGVSALAMLRRGFHAHESSLSFIGMNLFGVQIGAVLTAAAAPSSSVWLAGALMTFVGAAIGTYGAFSLAAASLGRVREELGRASVRQVQALQDIEHHHERMHDLRSGLLAIEAFAGSLEPTPSVHRLVDEVARLREMVAASRQAEIIDVSFEIERVAEARRSLGIDIRAAVEPDLRVHLPRVDLTEMVQNLVDNAVSHAPDSRIEITASRLGDRVAVKVFDDGPGFDEVALAHCLERGFTSRHDGTGLGLHIVHRLASAHGGSVTVMNRASGGALVQIELPSSGALVDA